MPDASLSWYTGRGTEAMVSIGSRSPGVCAITLTFATGFTYSTNVTFTSQTLANLPGCPQCPAFIGPADGPFRVDNPSDTCVKAKTDGGSIDAADAG